MLDKETIYSFAFKLNVDKKDVDYLLKYKKYENFNEIKTDIKKIAKKYPIQYIVGNVNFFGYNFKVTPKVLIPRFETELLVEKTIKYINKYFNKKRILIADICSGTGCIGITLKQEIIGSSVYCIEKYAAPARILEENNAKYRKKVKILKGDLLKPLKDLKFDIIISNPPYIAYDETIMAQVKKYEPSTALYAPDDGLYFYEEILKSINKNLKRKSLIAFEIGMLQGKKIKEIIEKYLPKANVIIEQDFNNRDRYIFIFNNIV